MLPIQSVLVAVVLMTDFALANVDHLNEALIESYGINMDNLYDEAMIHLDMESLTTVSSKLNSTDNVMVYSAVDDSCNTILQTDGIPWNDNTNSAMRINDTGSYVEVNTTVNSSADGLSVSLWIKNSGSDESSEEGECTVLTVGIEGQPNLQLKRRPDGHNYSLYVDNANKANFSFQETWEWNMLSFTVNNGTGHVTAYENGAAKPEIQNVGSSFDLSESNVVTIRLNGDDFSDGTNQGCREVEVDEVALWTRTLNMSEFIALRVQPFDTNCTVNVTVLVDRIEKGLPRDASAAVAELVIVVQNADEDEDVSSVIGNAVKATTAMQKNELLSHPELDEETKKDNREAFVQLTSAILDAAAGDPKVSDDVKDKGVVMRMDEVMNAVYFADNFNENETIETDFITMKYIHLDEQPGDGGLTIIDDSVKFNIPNSVFGTANPRIIVTVFDETLNDFVASDIGNATLADRVVSLQLHDVTGELQDQIELIFPNAGTNNADKLKNNTPNCNYLDLTVQKWKTDGMETKEYKDGDEDLVCYVSHLTNFAVLLSPNELEKDQTLEALTYVLLAISIICLIITLVVLMCLREIANTQRVQILKHFIFALLMSQLLFVFTTDLIKNKVLCMIFAAILHYFWLATFTWMLVQGIQLYTKVRRLVGGNIKQLFYVLFAWGFPLPIATIPLAVFNEKYKANSICWIPADLIWFFAVPVVLVFFVNLGVTVLVMKTFLTVKVNKDKSDAEKLKSSMRAVVVMVPVLGLTWAFGFLLLVDQHKLFQYLFVILNTTQGVFVFLFHLVLNEDVRSAVLRRRNKVAANAENTIFTKLPRNKSEHSGGTGTETSKAPLNSDSTTGM